MKLVIVLGFVAVALAQDTTTDTFDGTTVAPFDTTEAVVETTDYDTTVAPFDTTEAVDETTDDDTTFAPYDTTEAVDDTTDAEDDTTDAMDETTDAPSEKEMLRELMKEAKEARDWKLVDEVRGKLHALRVEAKKARKAAQAEKKAARKAAKKAKRAERRARKHDEKLQKYLSRAEEADAPEIIEQIVALEDRFQAVMAMDEADVDPKEVHALKKEWKGVRKALKRAEKKAKKAQEAEATTGEPIPV